MTAEPRKAVTSLSVLDLKKHARSNSKTSEKDAEDKGEQIEMTEEEKPKPRRKTVMRLMAQGERADKKEEAAKRVREEAEPLVKLVPMATALRLKEITTELAKELPQGISDIRMARLRAPKSSTGQVLRDGATVDQAATHAAIKALEQWVRILRPFASEEEREGKIPLGVLISKIVHVTAAFEIDREDTPLEVIPPAEHPLGAALRRIVPDPDILLFRQWEWLEDFLRALSHEEAFDRSSFVHRSSTPSGTMRQTGEKLVAATTRPQTTGRIPARRPNSQATRIRLSADFPWDSFQSDSGFRATTISYGSEKYSRGVPGPALYSDYDKHLGLPQNPARAVYPSVGDRRTPCITLPLTQLDRFFHQDFRLD